MNKRFSVLLTVFMICLPLAGCTTDSKEVDDQVYTLVVGCDKAVDNKIRLTVQYPTYKGASGGGGEGMSGGGSDGGGTSDKTQESVVDGTLVETIEASSILEGINLLNTSTTRRISFVHTKTIILSEDLARSGIKDYLQPLARFREARRIMQVLVCRGTAEDFIRENKSQIGESLSKSMELVARQSSESGFFPQVTFQDFYTSVISPYRQAYAAYAGLNEFNKLKPLEQADQIGGKPPLRTEFALEPGDTPRKGNRKIELVGTAIFDGDKMVGHLNSYETRYFLMAKGRFQKGIFTIEDKNSPGDAIPFDLRLARPPRIKTHFLNNKPIINIDLHIEADVGAIQSRIAYDKAAKIEDLNKQLEDEITQGIIKTIRKTQNEWGTDIFGFGKKIARNFFTVTEFEKYNWLKHYKDAEINVQVEADVRRTGLMIKSAPVRNSEKTIFSREKE